MFQGKLPSSNVSYKLLTYVEFINNRTITDLFLGSVVNPWCLICELSKRNTTRNKDEADCSKRTIVSYQVEEYVTEVGPVLVAFCPILTHLIQHVTADPFVDVVVLSNSNSHHIICFFYGLLVCVNNKN